MTQIESAHHPVVPAAAQRWQHVLRFGPGLLVALAAAVVTAHGLYEVVHAAKVPAGLAWLYPVITDGLAAVAYRATGRLENPTARRYAWFIVVLAAGVSGLAQASYLAQGSPQASPGLRFLVGAWPAIAAAMVAHLLYLLADTAPPTTNPHATRVGAARSPTAGAPAARAATPVPADVSTAPEALVREEERAGSDQHNTPDSHASREERATHDDTADGDSKGEGEGEGDREAGQRRWSDTERRAAAVADWASFLQDRPRAERAEKAEHAASVATRYGASLRWSYYRRGEAEEYLALSARRRDDELSVEEAPDLDISGTTASVDPTAAGSSHTDQASRAPINDDTAAREESGPDGQARPEVGPEQDVAASASGG